jgi:hypothetical protein
MGKMSYPGGNNAGDTETTNVEPALPGTRIKTPDRGSSTGASLEDGVSCREEIHSVTPEDIGADTEGAGQIHMQHPKTSAGRGTRWG